jgi:hypothetical protein
MMRQGRRDKVGGLLYLVDKVGGLLYLVDKVGGLLYLVASHYFYFVAAK